MLDPGIIRNKLKILAAIHNAQVVMNLQNDFGSFKAWLEHFFPQPKQDWILLFKKTFKFTGGEIVGEFLMSIGFLPGAHVENCPIYKLASKETSRFV
jgi:DNA-3-methyladenine glycosylase I